LKVSEFKAKYNFAEDFHTYPGTGGAVYDVHRLEYLKLCYVLHLYWIGPFREHAQGLLKFCDTAWDVIQPHVTHFRDNKKRRNPAKLGKSTIETLRSWLLDPDHAPPMMALLDLFNKKFDVAAADVRLDFNGLDFRGGGNVSLHLPAEWVESEPSRIARLSAELAGSFEFCSGLGGFGLSMGEREGHTVAEWKLYALGRHHLGIDLASAFSNGLGQGIKGVNWLTFVHPTFVERLGGRSTVGSALDLPSVKLVDLPSGILIQAGDEPVIGDTNRGLTCPTYHAVGRVLAKVRDRDYPPFIGNESGSYVCADRTAEWLGRFD
jgi:Protein of unknown function (DUF3396)